MRASSNRSSRIFRALLALFFFAGAWAAFPARSSANRRARLTPHFAAGQVFHYSVQTRIASVSHSSGPIANPEGARRLGESVSVVLRLQILSVAGAPSASGAARIRVTYQKAAATSTADSYDAPAAAIENQYKNLDGKSIEFTLQPDGEITAVDGLKKIIPDPSRAAIIKQWLSQLTLGASVPRKGIAIGEKWSSRQPLENVPLAGLAWRTQSEYLRNEPCPAVQSEAASGAGARQVTPTPSPEECAIILTRSEITGGRGQKDRTPDVFRKNGLRALGESTGSGDGLTAISLRTGMVVSVTQTAATHMDFTILSTTTRNRMRYAADTRSQSQISILSQSLIP